MGGGMDLRGGQSKKSDEAGKGISDLGKSEFSSTFFLRLPFSSRMERTHTAAR